MALSLPTFAAGSKVRASQLAQLVTALNTLTPLWAKKPTDESVNNAGTGTTLHNDAALFLPMAANATYWLDLDLLATEAAGTGIDLKVAWTFPALCRIDLGLVAPHNAWVATAGSALEVEWGGWQNVTSSPSASITLGTSNAATFTYTVRGTVTTGANAGNLQLQWAQGNTSASNVTVKAGSTLTLTQLP